MSSRVLATQTAERAAVDLRSRLQSLQGVTRQVLALGEMLADPAVWDGPEAARFRSEWPQMGGALRRLIPALESLQRSSETVVEQIIKAGSQGGVAGPAGSSTSPRGAYWYFSAASSAWGAVQFGAAMRALPNLVKTFASWPQTAQRIFGESIGPTALAFDRGEASLAELEDAAATAMRSVEAGELFSKVGAMRDFVGTGALGVAAKVTAPIAILGDIYTMVQPGEPGGEGTALRVAAGANAVGTIAALGAINASVDWIPVGGQVVAVGSGLFLAGDWAYHNIPAFHDFANTVGHDTVTVADDTLHGIEHAPSAVGHFFSSLI